MPKRTNEFQQLITFIEQAAAPLGAKVTESVELEEHEDDDSEREVDILIEHEVSGHPVRIGVECRAHKRRQDKTWIDQLYGRFSELGIKNIVAVSKSGFTAGALRKAQRLGIRTLTLEEAIEEDWKAALIKFDVRFCVLVREIGAAILHYAPGVEQPQDSERTPEWLIQGPSGEDPETIQETALRLYFQDAPRMADEYVAQNDLHAIQDPHAPDRDFEFPIFYLADERYVIPDDRIPRQLGAIELRVKAGLRHVDAAHQRFRYEASLVTVASARVEGEEVGKLAIVQPAQPGKKLTLKIGMLPATAPTAETTAGGPLWVPPPTRN